MRFKRVKLAEKKNYWYAIKVSGIPADFFEGKR